MVNLACESIWRKPLAHGVRIEESPVHSFWLSAQNAVKSDGVRCHGSLSGCICLIESFDINDLAQAPHEYKRKETAHSRWEEGLYFGSISRVREWSGR